MRDFDETQITKLIVDSYHEKLTGRIVNDVLIVGAGPAGLTAGRELAAQGFKVTLIERNLAPGGGIWGGGMGMNQVVFQEAALPILKDLGLRFRSHDGGLYTVEDIRKLYEFGGIRLTKDAVKTLRTICQTPCSGRLRTCSHVIAALHIVPAVEKSKQIDADWIIKAIESLDLPVRVRLPLHTQAAADEETQDAAAKAG